jgi:hypothetical protein
MGKGENVVPVERIEPKILVVRGLRVIVDSDLAELYGVETRALNQAVKRNADRFPADFMFQMTAEEAASLRSQFVTLKLGRGQHRKYLPFVFTEHGAIMAASILNSPRAVEVSVFVVRAFVKLRELLAPYREVTRRLDDLERKVGEHDETLRALVGAIRQLMAPAAAPRKRIGFQGEPREGGGSPKGLRAARSTRKRPS